MDKKEHGWLRRGMGEKMDGRRRKGSVAKKKHGWLEDGWTERSRVNG